MNFCFYLTQRIEPSFNMTQKILSTFQRFELFFWIRLKESTFFFNTTQKIEIFGWQKIELFPMNYDSKNWTFFSKNVQSFFLEKWFEEWNLLENVTHRIEFFKQKHDSNNWTLFTLTRRPDFFKTQRIELFFKYGSKNWIFV